MHTNTFKRINFTVDGISNKSLNMCAGMSNGFIVQEDHHLCHPSIGIFRCCRPYSGMIYVFPIAQANMHDIEKPQVPINAHKEFIGTT